MPADQIFLASRALCTAGSLVNLCPPEYFITLLQAIIACLQHPSPPAKIGAFRATREYNILST